jgi:hypothetical protein
MTDLCTVQLRNCDFMEVCAVKAILHIWVLICFYPYFVADLGAAGCDEAIHGTVEKLTSCMKIAALKSKHNVRA